MVVYHLYVESSWLGPHFVHTIKILFQDAFVVLSLNNCQTKAIELFKSVKQERD